jgi:Ni/Fe-hydrogenase subunit HybB-like protein
MAELDIPPGGKAVAGAFRAAMNTHSLSEWESLGGKVVTKPFLVLAALAMVGLILIAGRFFLGLGAVTNLSDGFPWGLWISYDVLVGTALGCGGYAMAFLIYIFNRWEYHPLVRSAKLTSVFGYTLAGVAILLDIGRYWNGYKLFLPWQINFTSVLMEVALCIAVYTVVLWLELGPTILEGLHQSPRVKAVRDHLLSWLPLIIALGVLLPTMHQSSLGTLMIIAGYKVWPLWQTSLLPLLFLFSALIMGFGATVLESILSSLAFKRPFETPILSRLLVPVAWLIGIYLAIRFGDLLARGRFGLIFSGDLRGIMFILENLCFLVPVLVAISSLRNDLRWLFVASVSMVLGGSLLRFNTFLVGYQAAPGWQYFPALPEIFITLGIISLELMGYLYLVKRFPVLPKVYV